MHERGLSRIAYGLVMLAICGGVYATSICYNRISRCRSAEDVVKRAIVAVIDDDEKLLAGMLYTDSADIRLIAAKPQRLSRVLATLRCDYHLDNKEKGSILSSVEALPNAPRRIVVDLIKLSYGHGYKVSYNTWREDSPIVVEYVVHGKRMISVALRDDNEWKVAAIPFGINARILEYDSVSEAVDDDAALIPPLGNK